MCRRHTASRLQQPSQTPEFGEANIGQVNDVGGAIDGGSVRWADVVADVLREVRYVFSGEKDGGEVRVFFGDGGDIGGVDFREDVDHHWDAFLVAAAGPLGLLGKGGGKGEFRGLRGGNLNKEKENWGLVLTTRFMRSNFWTSALS